jgi:hypothetical protein
MLAALRLFDYVDIAKFVDGVLDPSPRIQYHEIVLELYVFDALVLHVFAVQIRATTEEVVQVFLFVVQVHLLLPLFLDIQLFFF